MTPYAPHVAWIDSQAEQMRTLLQAWANVNSGTFNPIGLSELGELVRQQFAEISDEATLVPSGPYQEIDSHGKSSPIHLSPHVYARRRADANLRVLLAIHFDTVYGPESPFQTVELIDSNTLKGPGVADAKGGLVVMLYALKAFERFVHLTGQKKLGWEVIVNSDEEIGSPGSADLFAQAAQKAQIGLLFEPCLPQGGLVSSRKGTGNFTIVCRGASAHSGRDFHLGRNAVVAAAAVTGELHRLNGRWPEMTLNVARIDGGGPSNMIPALAMIRLNIRYMDRQHEPEITDAINEILNRVSEQTGVTMSLSGQFRTPPKIITPAIEAMFSRLHSCGKELGLELTWTPSGGSCDGNRLAALGIPNIDTLGVRGGKIHSHDEFVLLDSLTERAKLTALFLMKLADSGFPHPAHHPQ